MVARLCGVLAAVFLMHSAVPAVAQTTVEPIRYTLRFPEPHTHYIDVTGVYPTERQPAVELMMAVWTPGSYMVREYSRHVEALAATGPDGRPLAVEKTDKNRWRVSTGGASTVTVRYRVYAREMSVRTNWVEADFAMLNGAPTFITLGDGRPRPHEVVIEPAPGWRMSMTGLQEMAGGPHRYRAADYDTLVDSPILVGNPAVHEFTVDDTRHYLVNIGEAGVFDGARAAKDLETLVREHRRMWGWLPYDRYLFLNVLASVPGQIPGGGLEHRNSMLLIAGRWTTRTRQSYLAWLEVASHELFHAWNIKRLRPVELGPFNYDDEVFTRSLWIAEGVTDYYAELLVHRAGLSSQTEYLDALANKIEELQTTPGRLVQPVDLASFDAWIKYYRPDENTPNASISYYTKGSVIAFLLDARIRKASGGKKSLDDVMRAAYEQFLRGRGYTPDEFRAVTEQVSGLSLRTFWGEAVEGTAEVDYTEALDTLGLRFRAPAAASSDRPARAWLGMSTRNDAGRLVVTEVRRGTPAYAAGLNVDDEIIAVGDFRVRADQLAQRLDQYKPGDRVTLLVARRDELLRLPVEFGEEPPRRWRLEVNPSATDAPPQQRARWLQPGA
ncbi:MAG: M61 family metallopeptidase [Acidobacteria bacterium]|nr:M61 family metallopeptidase [Acidobacteriota bacterium]